MKVSILYRGHTLPGARVLDAGGCTGGMSLPKHRKDILGSSHEIILLPTSRRRLLPESWRACVALVSRTAFCTQVPAACAPYCGPGCRWLPCESLEIIAMRINGKGMGEIVDPFPGGALVRRTFSSSLQSAHPSAVWAARSPTCLPQVRLSPPPPPPPSGLFISEMRPMSLDATQPFQEITILPANT